MKTALIFVLCGLFGLQVQASTLFWQQADTSKPQSITAENAWNTEADGAGTFETPKSTSTIHFSNGLANVLIGSELAVYNVLFNNAENTNPIKLNLDFAEKGKLIAETYINFFPDWYKVEGASLNLSATLTPQSAGVIGSRTLLEAQSHMGIWHIDEVIIGTAYASVLSAQFEGYNYKGLVLEKDWAATAAKMKAGDAYLVYAGDVESGDMYSGNKIEVRWKTEDAVVPEPSTATLGLLGLAGLCLRRRRRA